MPSASCPAGPAPIMALPLMEQGAAAPGAPTEIVQEPMPSRSDTPSLPPASSLDPPPPDIGICIPVGYFFFLWTQNKLEGGQRQSMRQRIRNVKTLPCSFPPNGASPSIGLLRLRQMPVADAHCPLAYTPGREDLCSLGGADPSVCQELTTIRTINSIKVVQTYSVNHRCPPPKSAPIFKDHLVCASAERACHSAQVRPGQGKEERG